MKFPIQKSAICAVAVCTVGLAGCQDEAGEAPSPVASEQTTENQYEGTRVEDRVPVPDWFPSDIFLPEDYEATQSQTIGTRTFLLRGISYSSQSDLLAAYRIELASSGYKVTPEDRMPSDEPFIIFSGKGLESAGVRIRDDGDRREIEINYSQDVLE